jgi:hypothetical protein
MHADDVIMGGVGVGPPHGTQQKIHKNAKYDENHCYFQ